MRITISAQRIWLKHQTIRAQVSARGGPLGGGRELGPREVVSAVATTGP